MHQTIMEAPGINNNHCNSSFETEKWFGHEFLYKFQGFWFTKAYLETTQKVLENFKPLPKDVILASFPKTGTTWLKALLHSITNRHCDTKDKDSLTFNHPQELIPSLETNLYVREGPEFISIENPPKERILATHIPYQLFGEVLNSSECKIVYVTRNPKDTLISLWHFVQKFENFEKDPWELEAAVEHFCKGIVPFGCYFDHVLAYREESLKRPQNVFFVTYEELKENSKKCVEKIGEFLGCPFEGDNRKKEIEEIVKICSFERLSNLEVNMSSELPNVFPLPYNSFFRKGEVGDHMNYLDAEMLEKIDITTRGKFHENCFMYGI